MQDWLEALASAETAEGRRALLTRVAPPDAGAQLHAGILAAIYHDRPRAIRLNAAIQELATVRGDALACAWAARSQGHIDHVRGEYAGATEAYQKAAALFDSQGLDWEVGRTLSSGLQALIYRGEYEQAIQWAARAEAIFQRHGDLLRLARLDTNVGNIFFRQDRPQDALARYQRALEGFEVAGEPRDIAAALSNLAVASINLGQFSEALAFYRLVGEHCAKHELFNLSARADYNIAYLYYLRGDYTEARRLYQLSRERCRDTGDDYHSALCDLDEAEMYLELNLIHEGETLARRAVDGFSALGMPYEQAKALVNLAVAGSHRRDYAFADKTLLKARRLFVAEKNPVWPALVDQLRAVLAFHELRFDQALRLSSTAWRTLTRTMVPGRAAHCQIVLSRLWLRAGYADRARTIIREALEFAGPDCSPSLRFHANLVEGEIHERQGRWDEALTAYEAARLQVEDLRVRVDTEDLRISILKDKLAVYEGLVALYLDADLTPRSGRVEQALLAVQQAKSRSLADRLGVPTNASGWLEGEQSHLKSLRQDLNWIYRQIDLASILDRVADADRSSGLRAKAREIERRMMDSPGAHPILSPAAAPTDVQSLQESLRDDELLLEYYEARGNLYVFLLSRSSLEAVRLGSAAPARQSLRLLQFQLGKFRWGKAASADAASHHFQELHRMLLQPVEDRLTPYRHLVFAPHRVLHGLPFAALHNGSQLLGDRFTLSVAPSASVFALTRRRRRGSPLDLPVVMAVPDEWAPRIVEEAQVVAAMLPDSRLLVGKDATLEAFWKYAPSARIFHLAAHGIFRRDNPVFSALQLADGRLSLLDLNQARLHMDLLTLSACNTASSVAVGGDELLGLMRGFLLAGSRSLLVALWEIDDASTQEFMRAFYREAGAGASLAKAVQVAMREVRERYRHPYYWAPFLLVGDPDAIPTEKNE